MVNINKKLSALSIWQGEIEIEPLEGGLTNKNYLVSDSKGKWVVRLGDDILEHHVLRFNELAASHAAHGAGLSPEIVHSEEGLMVMQYIPSTTFTPQHIRAPENLKPIVDLLKRCHQEVSNYVRGPVLSFNVFHIIRDYAWQLREGESDYIPLLDTLLQNAARLEDLQGNNKQVFSHNDLVAANILDDGKRLWLIDWDYAGFNSPLFDLANLASNNDFSPEQEINLLEAYYDKAADDHLRSKFLATKCASLLRETMWSMVSEIKSSIDHDFKAYTAENMRRFDNAYEQVE